MQDGKNRDCATVPSEIIHIGFVGKFSGSLGLERVVNKLKNIVWVVNKLKKISLGRE